MDSLFNNKSKIPKLKLKMKPPQNGNVSPLNNPYSPETLNNNNNNNTEYSPLMKYLRSSKSPISTDSFSSSSPSSIKHHQFSTTSSSSGSSAEKSPLSDEVLVMDGILIGSGHGSRVLRSSGSDLKLEVCRAWEDFGHCRFASKCQFAHGKEELRPTRFPIKNKSEAQLCKTYTSMGSCPYGSKCRFVHQIMPEAAAAATTQMISPNKHEQTSKSPITTAKPEYTFKTPTSTIKSEHTSKTPSSRIKPKLASKSPGIAIKKDSCKTSTSTVTSRDWSPINDGIEVALPSHADKLPSREEIDEHIDNILYGQTKRRRLPVFTQILPE